MPCHEETMTVPPAVRTSWGDSALMVQREGQMLAPQRALNPRKGPVHRTPTLMAAPPPQLTSPFIPRGRENSGSSTGVLLPVMSLTLGSSIVYHSHMPALMSLFKIAYYF